MNGEMTIIAAGLLTTVQDLGRWGYQASGVSVSGAMDPFAHRLANALVGNDPQAATLEVTLAGPTVSFESAVDLAVAGADFELYLDGRLIPCGRTVPTRPGSVLRFGACRVGARAYLAVSGGIDVAPVHGSRSTHLPSGMGGFHGRALRRGDRVPIGQPPVTRRQQIGERAVATAAAANAEVRRDVHRDPVVIRVLPGPQQDRFTADALQTLVSADYAVDPASDRMGYRLLGAALPRTARAEVISDATPLGSIQVPASGQPLLLMADRQTTGGYPKLATVISADIGVAAQAAPGARVRFQVCTRADALAALVARERRLLALDEETT
jgi:antagonist of KipI